MGIFYPYIKEAATRLIGVEAAGEGMDSGKHSASIQRGSPGVLHGNRTYVLQDDNGQVTETHSISAGLDYPGVGPEHAFLNDIGRAEYVGITDTEALDAFHYLCRTEGIIPALESSHAVAYAMKLAKTMRPDQSILVNLSGRGDKDIGTVADLSHGEFFCRPSCQGQSVKGGVVLEQPVKLVKLVKNGVMSDAGPPQGAKAPLGGNAAHAVASVGARP
jgi:tryptophan synthase beta chain